MTGAIENHLLQLNSFPEYHEHGHDSQSLEVISNSEFMDTVMEVFDHDILHTITASTQILQTIRQRIYRRHIMHIAEHEISSRNALVFDPDGLVLIALKIFRKAGIHVV